MIKHSHRRITYNKKKKRIWSVIITYTEVVPLPVVNFYKNWMDSLVEIDKQAANDVVIPKPKKVYPNSKHYGRSK